MSARSQRHAWVPGVLRALEDVQSNDPAAAAAMRAVRLSRWTLEQMRPPPNEETDTMSNPPGAATVT